MTQPVQPGNLFPMILAFIEAERPFAVVTVLRADGSTPVPAGAKAIVEPDGTIHGTVGGGAAEAKARQRAIESIRTGRPTVFDCDLRGPGTQEASPICGGVMRLLVDPTAAASAAEYRRAVEALARRDRGVWLTAGYEERRRGVQSRYLPETDVPQHEGLPDAAMIAEALAEEEPLLMVASEKQAGEVLIEPLLPRPVLLIVGGGHVGQAVAAQADLIGFDLVVVEDRPEFADPQRFPPGTATHCGAVPEELAAFPITSDTFIVIVTRGHQQDAVALRACIRRSPAYLGMIGSRRKIPLVRQLFLESGWATAEEFERVYAPIGLDLGAVTVPEIAASIIAQIIAVRRQGRAPRIQPV